MQWLARVISYEAFSPESTMTLFLYPTFFCLIFEEEDESDTEDNQEDGEGEIFTSMLPSRNSVRPKRMFKTRMAARMFGKAMAIPKTMTISQKMRRSKAEMEEKDQTWEKFAIVG